MAKQTTAAATTATDAPDPKVLPVRITTPAGTTLVLYQEDGEGGWKQIHSEFVPDPSYRPNPNFNPDGTPTGHVTPLDLTGLYQWVINPDTVLSLSQQELLRRIVAQAGHTT